jgi:hypothetical protein
MAAFRSLVGAPNVRANHIRPRGRPYQARFPRICETGRAGDKMPERLRMQDSSFIAGDGAGDGAAHCLTPAAVKRSGLLLGSAMRTAASDVSDLPREAIGCSRPKDTPRQAKMPERDVAIGKCDLGHTLAGCGRQSGKRNGSVAAPSTGAVAEAVGAGGPAQCG